MSQTNILDIFDIEANDVIKQWEFTPRVDGYTSYTVSYKECSNKADASIAVWRNIKKQNQ
jgi:hypothetical protein